MIIISSIVVIEVVVLVVLVEAVTLLYPISYLTVFLYFCKSWFKIWKQKYFTERVFVWATEWCSRRTHIRSQPYVPRLNICLALSILYLLTPEGVHLRIFHRIFALPPPTLTVVMYVITSLAVPWQILPLSAHPPPPPVAINKAFPLLRSHATIYRNGFVERRNVKWTLSELIKQGQQLF